MKPMALSEAEDDPDWGPEFPSLTGAGFEPVTFEL